MAEAGSTGQCALIATWVNPMPARMATTGKTSGLWMDSRIAKSVGGVEGRSMKDFFSLRLRLAFQSCYLMVVGRETDNRSEGRKASCSQRNV